MNSCDNGGEGGEEPSEEHEGEGGQEDEEEEWGMMAMTDDQPMSEWKPWKKSFKHSRSNDANCRHTMAGSDARSNEANCRHTVAGSTQEIGGVVGKSSLISSPIRASCNRAGPPVDEPNRVAKPSMVKGSRKRRTWERMEDVNLRECGYIRMLTDKKSEEAEREVIVSFEDKGKDSEWVKVEAYVDSAAVATVMKADTIPGIEVVESEGSKKGHIWWSASNHPIKNEGQKVIPFRTSCGKKRRITFQIAKVSKPLVSVNALNDTGHDVILSKKNPRIVCPNGEEIKLRAKNKVFILDMFVRVVPFARR